VASKYILAIMAAVALSTGCLHSGQRAPAPSPATSTTPGKASVIVQQAPVPSRPAVGQAVVRDSVAIPATTTSDTVHVSATDVTRRAIEVFGDTAVTGVTADVDSAVAGPSWDIEVRSYQSTARVEHYVRMFTGSAKEHIAARLEQGTRYEPMIRAKMREGGLPEDMYYLALIESGFDPNAYSRAAAVGMWQFMTSTARDMGMRVDWWVDERRDPIRSTSAAVRFIKGLKEQFGSLYLAAAAYNGGPGRVARGLTRYADDLEGTTGDDLFFALAGKDYLRNETREYVPQLIAAALIAKEPQRYGMKLTPLPPFAYDSVRVGPATPLAAIAHAACTTVGRVQELNPQVLRGMTPPKDSFLVRLPVGAADGFSDSLAALPAGERRGMSTVVSKKGESGESIARKAGIATRQIAIYNPKVKRLKNGNLVPGQAILVPTAAVVAASVAVPDPAIERYGSSRSTTMHVVKSGETLGALAKKYHTTTAALMRANGLRRALIFPGQSLVVHSGSRGAAKKRVATKSAHATASKSSTAAKATSKKKVGAAKRSAH
jgi:membrane-bound lytic murein transglycosylase D